jgi:hypothetical protein
MAQYHLSAHAVISRSNGQKVVRSAAYAAGERLYDDRYGEVHDFTRRRHVLYNAMTAPENAPDWARDRGQFWNALEQKENRKNSQLAIPYDIALPYELTLDQNIALIREYAKAEFTDRGLVADIAIHRPDPRRDPRNVHAHILIPTRPIDENGFGPKTRNATTREGWEQEREENILRLRESWAEHHNRHMAAAGFDNSHYIDHRSLEDQGIEREPTTHRGVASDHMEQRGITTGRGDDYRDIQAENQKRALRKRKRKDYAEAPEAAPMPDSGSPADKVLADARAKEQERQDQAHKQEQERQEKARKDQDKLQEELVAADKKLKELGQIHREAQAHRDRLVQQTQELEALQSRIERELVERYKRQSPVEAYLSQHDRTVQDRRQEQIDFRDRRYLEGDIRDSGTRYSQALNQHYDGGDPYQSLAKAAMAEHTSFRKDQELLTTEIAKTADPKAREALEIRRRIEGYEYLMITGERIAVQSELITGRTNSEEAVKMRNAVRVEILKDENGKQTAFPGYTQLAENLRFRYRELQAERTGVAKEREQPQSAAEKIVADAKRQTPERAAPDKQQERPVSAAEKIVADAKLRTPAPSRSRKTDPDKYKDLDPQKAQDQQNQQQRDRKAQKDRGRER